MDRTIIDKTISNLTAYIEKENYKGWDPYDYLSSWIPFRCFGKMAQAVAVQAGKLIPFNLRPIMGIRKEEIPKGLGLLLNAYCELYNKTNNQHYLEVADYLYERLLAIRSSQKKDYCWGCNFIWANPHNIYPRYMPSVVVTSFVGQGIYKYYLIKQSESVKTILLSIGDYIINSLHITETDEGICFSYTEEEADCCYNASLHGAEMLSIIYSISKNEKLLKMIRRCVDFVIAHQHKDGSWGYSIDIKTKKERMQIDFHQGFVLSSLRHIVDLLKLNDERIENAVKRGLEYYRGVQFNDMGFSLWRVPKQYPVEIHNQAQGIITFMELSSNENDFADFANTIAEWTIKNMKSKNGYFYYRKYKWYTIKIPYMRWSQAWMLLALVTLKSNLRLKEM